MLSGKKVLIWHHITKTVTALKSKDMNNSRFILGASFIAGCLILGLCAVWATKANRSFERTVAVKGLCERQVKADKVIWPLAYKFGGNSLTEMYSRANSMNDKIVKFLTAAGVSQDEISVNPPKIEDNRAVSYNNNATYNYLITSVVTVYSENIDLIIELQNRIGELISQGVPVGTADSWSNPTVFSYNGLNDIKPEMIEEATANARAAAQKFAKDCDSRLGKIKTATQGQFTITDRDSNTPYIKNVRVVTSVEYYLND